VFPPLVFQFILAISNEHPGGGGGNLSKRTMNRPGIEPVQSALVIEDDLTLFKKQIKANYDTTDNSKLKYLQNDAKSLATTCCLRFRFLWGLIIGALVGIVFMASRCNTHMETMFETLQSSRAGVATIYEANTNTPRPSIDESILNLPINSLTNGNGDTYNEDEILSPVVNDDDDDNTRPIPQTKNIPPIGLQKAKQPKQQPRPQQLQQQQQQQNSGPVAVPKLNGKVSSQSATSKFVPSNQCQVSTPDAMLKRNFNMVLLSSFPRSGSSWTRLLLHGGHQYMDRGISTSSSMSVIGNNQMYQMSTCKLCTSKLSKYILSTLKIAPDPFKKGDQADLRNFYGIAQKAVDENQNEHEGCKQHFKLRQKNPLWRRVIPPVLIKSHYPFIQDKDTENFIDQVNKIIHLVRNPFDNLASRFLGTKHKFQVRWDELVKARENGKTTKTFEDFLKHDIKEYITFHKYWLNRRESDAANGVPTLFTRYESLCAHTSEIVPEMVKFGGWNFTQESFTCTLNESPCVADQINLPNHAYIYTDEQKQFVINTAKPILEVFGYQFDSEYKMSLIEPSVPMCNY